MCIHSKSHAWPQIFLKSKFESKFSNFLSEFVRKSVFEMGLFVLKFETDTTIELHAQ